MASFRSATEVGTQGAWTLPAAAYTSPTVFGQEVERIFSQEWLCVGREAQLPSPGSYFVRNWRHESLLVVRDLSGEIRAFHNVCRHRGARLCSAAAGTFSKTIQCPYHAWTYGLSGELVGAPSMELLPGFCRDDFPLVSLPLACWEGFVFVSLSPQPEPFATTYSVLHDRFQRFQLPTLAHVRTIQYSVAANWKLIFENYSECYHCPTVHPELVKLSPADSGENDLISGRFLGGYMTITQAGGSMTHSGRACARPVADLPSADLQRVYYYSLFPNVLLSLHSDYVMVHTLWPQDPGRTEIECSWLFHPSAAADPDFAPADGIEFWDQTNRQDWAICEQSQLGVASSGYRPGPYSPRDSISAAFDREYLRIMGPLDDGPSKR